ncbi:ABC transporter ATP-binding protein, partial [Desulfobacteraceae bacterium SEEP-SAG9]
MANEPIIKARNLIAQYGEDVILDNITFDIFKGEIFVILGASGCGKSTLLRHIVGLDRAVAGKVIVDGVDI